MKEVKVSVICLTYNHEKYIKKALEGFVSQKTDFSYEVLIHDDASTDGTANIIREYQKAYPEIIKPFFQTENQYSKGIRIVRQYLLPYSKGEFLAFCEGDDYWVDENKLQKQYDVMMNNPKVVFCAHKVQCVNEDDSYNNRIIPSDRCGLKETCNLTQARFSDLLFIKGSYCFQTSSYFIQKKVYMETETLRPYFNGDQTMLYAALKCGEVYYISEVMSKRRLMTIGNFHQRFLLLPDEQKMNHHLKKIDGNIFFDDWTKGKYSKKILYNNYLQLMQIALKYKEAKKYFKSYRKKYKFNWFISLKLDVAYILYYICPYILKKKLSL